MTLLPAQEKECMVNHNIKKFKSISKLLPLVFVTNTNEESRESVNKNRESIKKNSVTKNPSSDKPYTSKQCRIGKYYYRCVPFHHLESKNANSSTHKSHYCKLRKLY